MSLSDAKTGLWALLILPLLVVILFGLPFPPWPDAIMYDSIMRDFLKTGFFRCLIFSDFDPSYMHANFDNGPVFSLLHLLVFKLLATTDSRVMILVNFALVVLSTINIAKILKLSGRTSLLLIIIAFNPFLINSAGLIRPEWLNVFFISCIWRLFACHKTTLPGPLFAVFVGFLLALAVQTHYFSVFFVPIIFYMTWITEKGVSARLRTAAQIAFATILFLIPYLVYITKHSHDFYIQVLVNQLSSNTSQSVLQFVWHFFQPIMFPSTALFTTSHIMPTWLPNLFQLPVGAFFVGITLKWRHHVALSPLTRQVFVIWFILGAGTAVLNYMPYGLFFFSVAVVSLWKDLLPKLGGPKWSRIALFVAALSLLFSTAFYFIIRGHLFTWADHTNTVQCLSEKIPVGKTVYIMAYPDPSVALSNLRPDLNIRRYSDFSRYTPAWAATVKKSRRFITSVDGNFLRRFDHDNALQKKIQDGELEGANCSSGSITYTLWTQRQ